MPKIRIAERAAEISAAIFERASHLDVILDAVAVSELSRLVALAEGLDADLEKRGVTTGSGGLRGTAKLRTEVSRAILSWTSALGGNPKTRAEIIGALKDVSRESFADSYARRVAALNPSESREST